MGSGGSRRYQEAIGNKKLLTAKKAAAFLGVSIKWLRENLECSEWHHCNFKYGDHARAFFWDRDDLQEILWWLTGKTDRKGQWIVPDDIFWPPERPDYRRWDDLDEFRESITKARMRKGGDKR